MFGRARDPELIRVMEQLSTHVRGCETEKAEIKRRLDHQDTTSEARHRENVDNLTTFKESFQRFERKVTWGLITLLLTIIGAILASTLHFKLVLG